MGSRHLQLQTVTADQDRMKRRLARPGRSVAPQGDEGITILETVLALSLFALVIIGLVASVSAGLDITGRSNGRQAATQETTKILEDLRSAAYTTIGMQSGTTYDTGNATTPDGQSPNNTSLPSSYTPPIVPAIGSESMVSGDPAMVTRHKTTSTVGGFALTLYTYVTWADSGHTQKRVTVVTTWNQTVHAGGLSRVVLSSIYTSDKIDFPTTTASTAPVTSLTTPTSTPSTTATTLATCPGDTAGPTSLYFVIAAGSGPDNDYITTSTPTLIAAAADSCQPTQVAFASANSGPFTTWYPISATPTNISGYSVGAGDGLKTVYARFRDAAGNQASTTLSDSAYLDTVNPSPAPTSVTANRKTHNNAPDTIDLAWDNNTADANMYGYYVYRQSGSTGSFTKITTVVVGTGSSGQCGPNAKSCGYTDTPGSTTSQTYYIVGVDRAGNITANSNQASA